MPRLTTFFTTSRRQSAFYALMFAMTGASLPFMPVWLKSEGMTGEQIGVILALPLLLRAVTGPLCGLWADRFALYRTPMIWLAAAGCLFYALMGLSQIYGTWRFAAFLFLYASAYTCSTSVSPLIDSMTLQLSRSLGFAYAIPRSIGSLAFIVAEVLMGLMLVWAPPWVILLWVVVAAGLMAVSGQFILPPEPRQDLTYQRPDESNLTRLRVLLATPGLVWVWMAVACLQASHSFYYAFSTLIWQDAGLSTAVCGYLWAVGVVAEISFMMFAERWRHRFGPWRMLVLAAVLSVLRWTIMASGPPLWMLWPLQVLHMFSFAAVYLAGLDLVYKLTPKGYEGLSQTVNSAYANGVMMGIGTLASGAVFAAFGVGGYGLMAGLAAVGLVCAGRLYLGRATYIAASSP